LQVATPALRLDGFVRHLFEKVDKQYWHSLATEVEFMTTHATLDAIQVR
jgi:hypothetical protein